MQLSTKYITGVYEETDNILHLWCVSPVNLNRADLLEAFFGETRQWVKSCPVKPCLLTNFNSLEIGVDLTTEYARQVKLLQAMVLGVFRYGLSEDLSGRFTSMAVRMGNMKNSSSSNIYSDEVTARRAIQQFKVQAQ